MYGGSILTTEQIQKAIPSLRKGHTDGYLDSEQLALQCCKFQIFFCLCHVVFPITLVVLNLQVLLIKGELQFLDPDYTINVKGKEIATVSSLKIY